MAQYLWTLALVMSLLAAGVMLRVLSLPEATSAPVPIEIPEADEIR